MAGTLSETTDVYLLNDFLPHMPGVSSFTALGHRLVRRLSTPRGFFPFWPNFGLDIRRYSLSKVPPWQMAHEIAEECKKDEQVKDVVVSPTITDQGRTVHFDVLVQSDVGAFKFTMTATEAAATLVTLQKAA
jgi:hypothetical protein